MTRSRAGSSYRIANPIYTRTELAVLLACQTATGDSELPKETIHFAAGMLTPGHGSIVGMLWSICEVLYIAR